MNSPIFSFLLRVSNIAKTQSYTLSLEITGSIWMAGMVETSKLQFVSAFRELLKNVWLFKKFLLCCLCSARLVYG